MSGASEVPALLPCPFCGGDAKVVDATQVLGTWKVIHRCKTVGYLCVETSERERAIADWNRRARPVDTGREKALEEAANDPVVLDRVASAIEAARYPDREGPYGLYDYSGHTGGTHKPHCVRDFRDPHSKDWGAFILCTDDRKEAAALYGRLTREHIAAAAIRALANPENGRG